jgi:hypothetical protein
VVHGRRGGELCDGHGKKLRSAVRHHFLSGRREAGAQDQDEDAALREQWRQLGVDPDKALAMRPQHTQQPDLGGDIEIDPMWWPAWQLFLDTLNDWNVWVGLGGVWFEGLKVQAVESAMNIRRIRPRHRELLWWGLKVMEAEARVVRNSDRT